LVRDCIATNLNEGRGRVQLSPRTLGALALCPWTGNVRELANLIERLSIVCAGRVVEVRDLPPKYRPPLDWTLEIKTLEDPVLDRTDSREHLSEETALSVLEEVELEARPRAGASNEIRSTTPLSPALLPEEGLDLRAHLQNIERQLIEQALQRSQGTVAQAARLLNLRRTTLVEKMRKLGMTQSGEFPPED
jgi:sigma-54 dependent transcriptional regulator, flagellar regulatory protein